MLALQGTSRLASAALLFFPFLFSGTFCQGANDDKGSTSDAVQLFSGRWDLTLKSPDREYPSWLEIHQENGHPVAQMVGRWGNARPIPRVEVSDREITFVSPKEEQGSSTDLSFAGKPDGKALSGTLTGPNGARWTWSAVRAPLLQRESKPKWGKPISLFNGKDLTGWKMSEANSVTWKVADGTLISPGHGPEIISEQKFQDFKLHVEVNCGANANSGVYLRGPYEVQIEDDSIQEPPILHTGGGNGFLGPCPEVQPRPGEAPA